MATKKQLCNCIYSVILVFIAFATINLLITKFSGDSDYKKKMGKYVSVDFEVYGKVQGVFFRKYTQQKGEELNLVGWCMNTKHDTVVGQIQGEKNKVDQMKLWLQTKGSPQSKIDRAVFKNEENVDQLAFSGFDVKR